jgi:hypothetical protein
MPRTAKAFTDDTFLAAALEGLELQKRRIDDQIQEVRLLLGKGTGRRGRPPGSRQGGLRQSGSSQAGSNAKRGPGRMSAAARKRIAAAQKRRWAEYRKSAGKTE